MKLSFTKMHGLGNDFVVVDAISQSLPGLREFAKQLCDRRFGVGCDQLLVAKPSEIADLKMQIFNADGSEVEMCGNGIRCFALYARRRGLVSSDTMTVETLAGLIKPEIQQDLVKVDMGEPVLEGRQIPTTQAGKIVARPFLIDGKELHLTCVSMGNPHCVLYVDDLASAPLNTLGPILETHPLFPNRINVEFVQVIDPQHLKMRVWERGAGETLACGTGACAVLVASVLNGFSERRAHVTLPGGTLEIHWSESDNHVWMTGLGVEVFEGVIDL